MTGRGARKRLVERALACPGAFERTRRGVNGQSLATSKLGPSAGAALAFPFAGPTRYGGLAKRKPTPRESNRS